MASGSEGFHLINPDDIELGSLIGSGGFGDVFKANHKDWGYVAVKQMSLKRINESERGSVRRQQLKEAQKMWRAVSSPLIVTVRGVIDEPDKAEHFSIVMEYFENGSLKDFQKKYMQCNCWARKVKMVQQIALGMNYLHTLDPPIIHRDLKLENVFVGDGLEAKIGDLGLAVSGATSIKRAGVAGTASHIPPEATTSTNIEPDEAWDAFTFAITIYELVSGKDAWPQQNRFANDALIAVWVMKGHRPDLDVIPSDAPAELIEIIKLSWVENPQERPSFKVISKSMTDLFETRFKRELRKADRSISEQMDIVEESRAASQQKSESSDSDFWGSSGTTVAGSNAGSSNAGASMTFSDSGVSSDIRDNMAAMRNTERVASINVNDRKMDSSVDKRIVLVGRTRAGKSATGNTILGNTVFPAYPSAGTITKYATAHVETVFSEEIRVVDTPGLFDTEISNTETILELTKCLLLSSPGPHVVAFVIPIGRFTQEIDESVQIILKTFGQDIISHMMVIFTGADALTRHNTTINVFVKSCPEFLKELLSKCGNHFLAVNNLATVEEKTKHQKQIIEMVNSIITENHGQFYSNTVYADVTEMIQKRLQAQHTKETSVADVSLSLLDNIKQRIINNQDEILDFVQRVMAALAEAGFKLAMSKMTAK